MRKKGQNCEIKFCFYYIIFFYKSWGNSRRGWVNYTFVIFDVFWPFWQWGPTLDLAFRKKFFLHIYISLLRRRCCNTVILISSLGTHPLDTQLLSLYSRCSQHVGTQVNNTSLWRAKLRPSLCSQGEDLNITQVPLQV